MRAGITWLNSRDRVQGAFIAGNVAVIPALTFTVAVPVNTGTCMRSGPSGGSLFMSSIEAEAHPASQWIEIQRTQCFAPGREELVACTTSREAPQPAAG